MICIKHHNNIFMLYKRERWSFAGGICRTKGRRGLSSDIAVSPWKFLSAG